MRVLGVWTHASDYSREEDVERALDALAEAGFSLIVALVKGGSGRVAYGSSIAPTMGLSFDYVGTMAEGCRERGLKLHAWFCAFIEGGREPGGVLKARPELAALAEDGRPVGWACPSKEEARRYELSVIREFLERYEVDGVHLDYIRYPELHYYRACACPDCGGKLDPLNEEWVLRRASNVTGFVEEVRDLAGERGVELSAAVFPHYPACVVEVGQDWVSWCELGLLDWVAPMTYTNITLVAKRLAQEHSALVKGGLYEGLGKRSSISNLSPEKLAEQAKAVLEAGADGIIVFSHSSLSQRDLEVLSQIFK